MNSHVGLISCKWCVGGKKARLVSPLQSAFGRDNGELVRVVHHVEVAVKVLHAAPV